MGIQLSIEPTPEYTIWDEIANKSFLKDCDAMRLGNKAAGRRVRVQLTKVAKLSRQIVKESKIIRDRKK